MFLQFLDFKEISPCRWDIVDTYTYTSLVSLELSLDSVSVPVNLKRHSVQGPWITLSPSRHIPRAYPWPCPRLHSVLTSRTQGLHINTNSGCSNFFQEGKCFLIIPRLHMQHWGRWLSGWSACSTCMRTCVWTPSTHTKARHGIIYAS